MYQQGSYTTNNREVINTSELAGDIYYLTLMHKEQSATLKFVKR